MRAVANFLDEMSYFFMGREHRADISLTPPPPDKPIPVIHSLAEAFPKPPAMDPVENKVVWRRSRYEMRQLKFHSPVITEHARNNVIPAVYFRQVEKPLGSVLIVHGYRVQNYMFFLQACKRFADWGYNAMMFELPFHLSRAPESTFSGELTFTGHVHTTFQSMQQTLMEARGLVDYLRRDGNGPGTVGAFGVSLGGMLTGLLACLCADLRFAILTVPAGNTERLFLRHRMGEMIRKEYPDWKAHWQVMSEFLPYITLTKLKPAVPTSRILIQEALHDRIVPASVVEELWRAWGKPRRHIYPHGHLSVLFLEPSLWPDIRRFVKRQEPVDVRNLPEGEIHQLPQKGYQPPVMGEGGSSRAAHGKKKGHPRAARHRERMPAGPLLQ